MTQAHTVDYGTNPNLSLNILHKQTPQLFTKEENNSINSNSNNDKNESNKHQEVLPLLTFSSGSGTILRRRYHFENLCNKLSALKLTIKIIC